MGSTHRAERRAHRALLLYALAYDRIFMDDEAKQRVAELEEQFDAGEPNDHAGS